MPAGTGVWVVNTVLARTTVRAVSKSRLSAVTNSRMRSRPRKPAWPSFMWEHVRIGAPSIAVNAGWRGPPIPAAVPACMRCSWSPPYNRSVTLRRSCSFSGMSESEQQQRDPADLGHPYPRPQLLIIGQGQFDQRRHAGRVGQQPQGRPCGSMDG